MNSPTKDQTKKTPDKPVMPDATLDALPFQLHPEGLKPKRPPSEKRAEASLEGKEESPKTPTARNGR